MKTKTIKLSDKQKEVIRLMREGQRLHYITGYNASVFMQENKISFPTFFKLRDLMLIEPKESAMLSINETYYLTELGKTIPI